MSLYTRYLCRHGRTESRFGSKWNKQYNQQFTAAKSASANATMLAFAKPGAPICISTDTSAHGRAGGVGAVYGQSLGAFRIFFLENWLTPRNSKAHSTESSTELYVLCDILNIWWMDVAVPLLCTMLHFEEPFIVGETPLLTGMP